MLEELTRPLIKGQTKIFVSQVEVSVERSFVQAKCQLACPTITRDFPK